MSEEVKQEGEFKVKKTKPKQLVDNPEVVKVEIKGTEVETPQQEEVTKVVIKEEDAVQDTSTEESVLRTDESSEEAGQETEVGLQEVGQELQEPAEQEQQESPLQEVTDEPVEQAKEDIKVEPTQPEPQAQPQEELPENVDKLIKFMKETGGTVQDYVRLNTDYSNVDQATLIREYYKQTKPHLDAEDISLLMEDFSYDEELDDEKDIRKKKIAYKEEVAKAKNFLEGLKDKYYDEIKLRPGVTQEQQKAVDFFNRYNQEQEAVKQRHERFKANTSNLFNSEFKGFDFKVGDKKFRYGIKNPSELVNEQGDISNFIKTFLNKDGEVSDHAGYHKALYAARNADTLASHFYEQGKADAVKDQIAKSKNISTEPRKTATGDVFVGGLKVRAISGADSSKLKVKTKRFN
jgi:hypothetical protein|tara:strand:- start:2539 stop:3756 length:1218 start_codon:yes stop_codon:yes gene_type:complete